MNTTIDSYNYILLSTRKRDQSFVATPVWFTSDDNNHYVFSARDAGKVKRLRNFSEAKIAPCTMMGKPLGNDDCVSAEIIDDNKSVQYAHQLLLNKYGWQMRVLDFFSRLSGNYQKRAFIKISKP